MLTEVQRVELTSPDEISGMRQLSHDVARTAGLGTLVQAKFATATSELARRALHGRERCEVVFAVAHEPGTSARLVVTVSELGEPHCVAPRAPDAAGHLLELRTLRSLVDTFEVVTAPDGTTRATATVATDIQEIATSDRIHRLSALFLRPTKAALERQNSALSDAMTVLELQSSELARANEQLLLAQHALEVANAELALTNSGVVSLNAELEQRADSLVAANAALRQSTQQLETLHERQAVLAELGRQAIASTTESNFTGSVVLTTSRLLGFDACMVVRLGRGDDGEVVAAAGRGVDVPAATALARNHASRLLAGGTVFVEVPPARDGAPASRRELWVLTAVRSHERLWGVLVGCVPAGVAVADADAAFLEAVASLLGYEYGRVHLEEATRHASLHDPLTGLANRAFFVQRLEAAVAGEGEIAVAFVDLDDFKAVNDSHGHHVGDELLVEVAIRLRRSIRPDDLVARFGGDEFAALIEFGGDASEAASRISRIHEALSLSAALSVGAVDVGASIGWTTTAFCERSASSLLRTADVAMYASKRAGKRAVTKFAPAMLEARLTEALLSDQLCRAIERDELCLRYQPIADVRTGQVAGAEALLRWEHPDRGLLAPADFLGLAARLGLMPSITSWVLREACSWARTQVTAVDDVFSVAVNVTAEDLERADFVCVVERALTTSGLEARRLCVEITETGALANVAAAVTSLRQLRALGVTVSIDDFGTGYSSLTKLRQVPVDSVKIDRDFVDGLGTELDDTTMVGVIIRMAQALSLDVIAEGVETTKQLTALRAHGCDYVQGTLVGRPAPPTAPLPREHVARLIGVAPARPADAARPPTVVIADDLESDRMLINRSLGRSGRFVVVGEACNGLEAERVTAALHPDVLLLDLHMPGSDGLHALARIRTTAPETAVVVLTGHASPSTADEVMRRGALGCMVKGQVDVVADLERILRAGAGVMNRP